MKNPCSELLAEWGSTKVSHEVFQTTPEFSVHPKDKGHAERHEEHGRVAVRFFDQMIDDDDRSEEASEDETGDDACEHEVLPV